MEKKRRKRGENSYLNDFHPNLAGEYIYSGTLYACGARSPLSPPCSSQR